MDQSLHIKKPLEASFRCECGCLVRVTWLNDSECYSCGDTVEALGPRFRRTLKEIRGLPEPNLEKC